MNKLLLNKKDAETIERHLGKCSSIATRGGQMTAGTSA